MSFVVNKHYYDDFSILKYALNDNVKISNGKERFWVIIRKLPNIKNKWFTGEINNMLVFNENYDCGSMVKFKIDNIFDVQKKKIY